MNIKDSAPLILFDPFGISTEYNDHFFNFETNGLHVLGWTLKNVFTQAGYEVHTIDFQHYDRAQWIVFLGFPEKNSYYKQCAALGKFNKMAVFLFEPPVVQPASYLTKNHKQFAKIFTYVTNVPNQQKYFRFYFPQFDLSPRKVQSPSFSEKKFLVLMNGNKSAHANFINHDLSHSIVRFKDIHELYSARREVIHYCESHLPNEFDLFGPGWNAPESGWRKFFPRKKLRTYRGTVEDKVATLSRYKFTICYENATGFPGYITEKIFDCFCAQSVPVYWGATDIEDYIPSDCFIDRRKFHSTESLVSHLRSITEYKYLQYLSAMENFLHSARTEKWSNQSFATNLKNVLQIQ